MSNRIVAAIKAEITALLDEHDGQITAEQLVEYARTHPESALHRSFTWDDAEAAAKWRLEQAQQILRKFEVRVEVEGEKSVMIRGVVSLPSDRGPEHLYRSTTRVLSDEDQTAEMIEQAKRELAAFRHKYAMLRRLGTMSRVFESIGEVLGD